MIPGTIEEWKAALASSKPGSERNVCVEALLHLGAKIEHATRAGAWTANSDIPVMREWEYRVKPTPRPWNAEDARRHVGFAYRTSARIGIIGVLPSGELSSGREDCYWQHWEGCEYAEPKWGTDPSAWNWQKCEVVE